MGKVTCTLGILVVGVPAGCIVESQAELIPRRSLDCRTEGFKLPVIVYFMM